MTLWASTPLTSIGARTRSFAMTSSAGTNDEVAVGSGFHHASGVGLASGGATGGRAPFATGAGVAGRDGWSRAASRPAPSPAASTRAAIAAQTGRRIIQSGMGRHTG